MKPAAHEYPAYYDQYISKVDDGDVVGILQEQRNDVSTRLSEITNEQSLLRYAEDKWSVKELVGHLTDAERIFGTRALCIARGETQPLPGFDEDSYVELAHFDDRAFDSILSEWITVRDANIKLFETLDYDAMSRFGVANGRPITPRAIMWIVAGHTAHHVQMLRDRYQIAI